MLKHLRIVKDLVLLVFTVTSKVYKWGIAFEIFKLVTQLLIISLSMIQNTTKREVQQCGLPVQAVRLTWE